MLLPKSLLTNLLIILILPIALSLIPSTLIIYTSIFTTSPTLACICEYNKVQPLCCHETIKHKHLNNIKTSNGEINYLGDDGLNIELVWNDLLSSEDIVDIDIKHIINHEIVQVSARQIGMGELVYLVLNH
jgi:hypothetical protein